jgi:hypothetical protein
MDTREPTVKIEEFYVILGKNAEGIEGVATAINPRTKIMEPLIASESRLPTILTLAKAAANVSGMSFELVKFTTRESIELIDPDKGEEEEGDKQG